MTRIMQLLFVGCLMLLPALPASALSIEEFDLLTLYTSASVQYENNLFRLSDTPSPVSLAGIKSQTDRVTAARVGVGFDKSYGLQRLKLSADLYRYDYLKNDFLNYRATNYDALWQWSFTPDISGNATFSRHQQLADFGDYLNYIQRNLITSTTRRFDADWRATGGWHLILAANDLSVENSTVFTTEASYRQRGGEVGVNYQFTSGSSLTLTGRDFNGEYLASPLNPAAQLDTGFGQKEAEVLLNWKVTGKTLVNLRLTHLARKNDHFEERDYSGLTGSLQSIWSITGKITLFASLDRSLNSYQNFESSYYDSQGFTLAPVWQISDKISTQLMLGTSRLNYHGAIVSLTTQERSDVLTKNSLSVDWKPTRKITLSGAIQQFARRSSPLVTNDYDARVAKISAQIKF